MKIYLDVCCLNRPFDDSSQPRIALESAAVERLLELIETSKLTDYSSEIAQIEIERMPDPDRRRKVASLLPPGARMMALSHDLLDMAEDVMRMGFGLADAVHLSAARRLKVDVFLTVDDALLKRARRFAAKLGVRAVDPVAFLREFDDANDW